MWSPKNPLINFVFIRKSTSQFVVKNREEFTVLKEMGTFYAVNGIRSLWMAKSGSKFKLEIHLKIVWYMFFDVRNWIYSSPQSQVRVSLVYLFNYWMLRRPICLGFFWWKNYKSKTFFNHVYFTPTLVFFANFWVNRPSGSF